MMFLDQADVPSAALPVSEFRAHLRQGFGFSEETVQDPVLESFLKAAILAIEKKVSKSLISRSYSMVINKWQDFRRHPFPVAPVNEIVSVTIVDGNGEEVTIEPSLYWLQHDSQQPYLRSRNGSFPAIGDASSARITFMAGMASTCAALPADLSQAVMLLAAHYYEYRDETALGAGCMPFGVSSLIEHYRPIRLGARWV